MIDEDEHTHNVIYDKGLHTLTWEQIGTRYVAVPVRILVNPDDPADMAAAHTLQDGIVVKQDNAGTSMCPSGIR